MPLAAVPAMIRQRNAALPALRAIDAHEDARRAGLVPSRIDAAARTAGRSTATV